MALPSVFPEHSREAARGATQENGLLDGFSSLRKQSKQGLTNFIQRPKWLDFSVIYQGFAVQVRRSAETQTQLSHHC